MSARVGCIAAVVVLSLVPVAAAQDQAPDLSHKKPQTGLVRFTVQTAPEVLQLERVPLPENQQGAITRVTLKGGDTTVAHANPGYPQLPYYVKLVALPAGATIEGISAIPGKSTTTKNVTLVSWAQLAQPAQDPVPAPPPNQRPPVIPEFPPVGQDIPFFPAGEGIPLHPDVLKAPRWPAEIATLTAEDVRAGYRVLHLKVSPVIWDPQAATLTLFTDIAIEVKHHGGRIPQRRAVLADAMVTEELQQIVVNPDDVVPIPLPKIREIDAPYLIITDDYRWGENIRRDFSVGNVIDQFRRFAAWKTQKGIKAEVVTITDIVGGVYGNFTRDAADLQEVLRRFLKHARGHFNTYWVLLGGGAYMIPQRMVTSNTSSNSSHWIALAQPSEEEVAGRPPMGRAHWRDGARPTLRIHADWIAPDTKIVSARTGRIFERVGGPSADYPGWDYTTSATYSIESLVRTEHVILRGPTEDVADTAVYLILENENVMPTDLYYASVEDPGYGRPGVRDWDSNGNGIYGEHLGNRSLDGVSFVPDLAVGRVPITNDDDAAVWVDKAIAYEKYEGVPEDFGRSLLLVAANLGSSPAVREPTADNPPPVNRYYRSSLASGTTVHFRGALNGFFGWRFVSKVDSSTFIIHEYAPDASPARPGYFFCADETCTTPSVQRIDVLGHTIFEWPLPTEWVKVFEAAPGTVYFFDQLETDHSVVQKESVRDVLSHTAPAIDTTNRFYQDILDVPGGPAPDLFPGASGSMQFAWRDGWNLISLTGHGLPSGCCFIASYEVWNTRGTPGGVVFADTCLANRFSEITFLGSAVLTTPRGGAAAFVGHSSLMWIGTTLEQAFWRRFASTSMLGRLLHVKANFLERGSDLWQNYAFNLMGDPEMPLWRAQPRDLTVEGLRFIDIASPSRYRVLDAAVPVAGARVALTGTDGTFVVSVTDAEGYATFPRLGGPTRTLTLTATAQDFKPTQQSVVVARFR